MPQYAGVRGIVRLEDHEVARCEAFGRGDQQRPLATRRGADRRQSVAEQPAFGGGVVLSLRLGLAFGGHHPDLTAGPRPTTLQTGLEIRPVRLLERLGEVQDGSIPAGAAKDDVRPVDPQWGVETIGPRRYDDRAAALTGVPEGGREGCRGVDAGAGA